MDHRLKSLNFVSTNRDKQGFNINVCVSTLFRVNPVKQQQYQCFNINNMYHRHDSTKKCNILMFYVPSGSTLICFNQHKNQVNVITGTNALESHSV